MGERFIAARLRKKLDDDLYEATKEMSSESRSDLVRTGLRMALGITSQKVVVVQERPVSRPKIFFPGK